MLKLLGKKRRVPLVVLTLIATMGVVGMMAVPASAVGEVGAAVVTPSNDVTETAGTSPGDCGGHNTATDIGFDQVGTYTDPDGVTLGLPAVYAGQTRVEMKSTDDYRFDAWGTRPANYTCVDPLGVLDPLTTWVPADTVTIETSGIGVTNFPQCTLDDARFLRIGITTVIIEASGTACEFEGAAAVDGSLPDTTVYRWVLETIPCGFPIFPPDGSGLLFPCDDFPPGPSYIMAGVHEADALIGPLPLP